MEGEHVAVDHGFGGLRPFPALTSRVPGLETFGKTILVANNKFGLVWFQGSCLTIRLHSNDKAFHHGNVIKAPLVPLVPGEHFLRKPISRSSNMTWSLGAEFVA